MAHPSICAYCRHWEVGTLEHCTRRLAEMVNSPSFPCHVKQPNRTNPCDTCPNFEPAHLVNDPECDYK